MCSTAPSISSQLRSHERFGARGAGGQQSVIGSGSGSVPAKDLKELLAWLKTNRDKVSQGHLGNGTLASLRSLHAKDAAAQWTFVPYRGAAPAMQDLVGGQIDVICAAPGGSSLPLAQSGQIKAFAVMSGSRLPNASEIPTADEAGLPDFHLSFWQALWAPSGTPKDIIVKLNAAAVAALADPAVRARLAELGQDYRHLSSKLQMHSPRAQERSRKVVADYQGGRDQAGLSLIGKPRGHQPHSTGRKDMTKMTSAVSLAAMCLGVAEANAQSYPSRPITAVIGYAAGGPTDTIARIVTERMKTALGQPILVENVHRSIGQH